MSTHGTAVLERGRAKVLTVTKPAMSNSTVAAMLEPQLTVKEATQQMLTREPKADAERQLQQQLRRELGGPHDFLAIGPGGTIRKVAPTTTLLEIAVPREIKTTNGWEELPVAAYEVQAYMAVGGP
jgi:hypothetical protein